MKKNKKNKKTKTLHVLSARKQGITLMNAQMPMMMSPQRIKKAPIQKKKQL